MVSLFCVSKTNYENQGLFLFKRFFGGFVFCVGEVRDGGAITVKNFACLKMRGYI